MNEKRPRRFGLPASYREKRTWGSKAPFRVFRGRASRLEKLQLYIPEDCEKDNGVGMRAPNKRCMAAHAADSMPL